MNLRSAAALLLLAACSRPARDAGAPAEPGVPPLDLAQASRFAALSLACIDREYPNKPGHIYDADTTVRPPREVTPAFLGCFDWHSAVHGHWALVRLLRRFPQLPEAAAIRAALDRHLTADRIAAEVAFFRAPRSATFERPYGWAWLLRLAAELHGWDDPQARAWSAALDPLARLLAGRAAGYFARLSVPVREGVHPNTAFAMSHMLDWARAAGDAAFAAALEARARALFLADRDCPADYEPSGEDFVSPCLAEADLMRRVLPRDEFARWLDAFLPAASPRFAPFERAVEVRDLKDPRIGHLIGLGFHRAWCLEGIAAALPPGSPHARRMRRAARVQAEAALGQMADSGYGGEHWLASFAVYLRTGVGREVAP